MAKRVKRKNTRRISRRVNRKNTLRKNTLRKNTKRKNTRRVNRKNTRRVRNSYYVRKNSLKKKVIYKGGVTEGDETEGLEDQLIAIKGDTDKEYEKLNYNRENGILDQETISSILLFLCKRYSKVEFTANDRQNGINTFSQWRNDTRHKIQTIKRELQEAGEIFPTTREIFVHNLGDEFISQPEIPVDTPSVPPPVSEGTVSEVSARDLLDKAKTKMEIYNSTKKNNTDILTEAINYYEQALELGLDTSDRIYVVAMIQEANDKIKRARKRAAKKREKKQREEEVASAKVSPLPLTSEVIEESVRALGEIQRTYYEKMVNETPPPIPSDFGFVNWPSVSMPFNGESTDSIFMPTKREEKYEVGKFVSFRLNEHVDLICLVYSVEDDTITFLFNNGHTVEVNKLLLSSMESMESMIQIIPMENTTEDMFPEEGEQVKRGIGYFTGLLNKRTGYNFGLNKNKTQYLIISFNDYYAGTSTSLVDKDPADELKQRCEDWMKRISRLYPQNGDNFKRIKTAVAMASFKFDGEQAGGNNDKERYSLTKVNMNDIFTRWDSSGPWLEPRGAASVTQLPLPEGDAYTGDYSFTGVDASSGANFGDVLGL